MKYLHVSKIVKNTFLVGISTFFIYCGKNDSPNPNENTISTSGAAVTMAGMTFTDLDTLTEAVRYLAEDFFATMQGKLAGIDQGKVQFTCDQGTETGIWKGYCWIEVTELPLGMKPGGMAPANFDGRIGYKDDFPNGITIQTDLSEHLDSSSTQTPQKVSLLLLFDAYNMGTDSSSGGALLHIKSPNDQYSYITKRSDNRLEAFCNVYLPNEEKLTEYITNQNALAALAVFNEMCTTYDAICEKYSSKIPDSITEFMFINNLSLAGKDFRGSFLFGLSESNTTFRDGVGFAVAHWGYPAANAPTEPAKRSRILVKFKGSYKGINYNLPETQGDCYVLDLSNASLQEFQVKVEKWAETVQSGSVDVPDPSTITLPTEKCPLACISDAECAKGELCDKIEGKCVAGCKSNTDCPTTQPNCCLSDECKAQSTISGAGVCKITDSENSYECKDDTTCPTEPAMTWCRVGENGKGYCIPGCREDGDCGTGKKCCKSANAHVCAKTCLGS